MSEKSLEEELAFLREREIEVIGLLGFLKPVMQANVDVNFTLSRDEHGFGKLYMHPLAASAEDAGDKPVWYGSVAVLSPSFLKTFVDKD
jgi:hypothetical protein